MSHFSFAEQHDVHFSILDIFFDKRPHRVRTVRQLLDYLYQTIFCSECRLHCLWAMGRRKLISRGLLEECLFDCGEDVRQYARNALRRMDRTHS